MNVMNAHVSWWAVLLRIDESWIAGDNRILTAAGESESLTAAGESESLTAAGELDSGRLSGWGNQLWESSCSAEDPEV